MNDVIRPLRDSIISETTDDASLLWACRAGNATAWEVLVRRYQRLIYAIPRRAGLSQDQASEVFQRVCLTLLEHLDRIAQPERLGAWLATTAQRESWRLARRERATQPLGDDEDEGVTELPDPALLPQEVLERLERQHQVRQALATLDLRSRTLLSMLFLRPEPATYAEIAGTLGIPEGSIGPTRARCLQKLRRALEAVERA
jgi:RNA polymerase sigma factor (sigma-70 family)